MVNGEPKAMSFSLDLHKDLIKMPSPVRIALGKINSLLSDFTSEHWAKFIPPIAHSLVANVDTPFMKKVFDIAK